MYGIKISLINYNLNSIKTLNFLKILTQKCQIFFFAHTNYLIVLVVFCGHKDLENTQKNFL